ncbi:MAG: TSUP family transporter [Bdellovibrionota bacterium]
MELFFLTLAGFFAGFVDAIVGGGGLIFLPTLLALGIPPVTALGSNKAVGISTAIASTTKYAHSKQIKWLHIKVLIPCALVASIAGAYTATNIDPKVLSWVIPLALTVIFIYLLVKKDAGQLHKDLLPSKWGFVIFPAIAFYDGFIGPGTGTFLCVSFITIYGYSLLPATANSKLLNLTSNLGALLFFSFHHAIQLELVWTACIASFVGGYLGAKYAIRIGSKRIRPLFITYIGLLLTKLLYDLFEKGF